MSTRRRSLIVVWLFGLGACLILFAVVGASPMQSDPFHAVYLDNQTHTIADNSDLWYKFDYGLANPSRTVASLTMVNGTNSGVSYEVWAPELINDWWEQKPTGRGTSTTLDCDTGLPSANGGCQSPDLTWSGSFGAFGTYYVHVINSNSSPSSFLLTVQGDSVTLGPSTPNTPAPQPPAVVAPAAKTATPVAIANTAPRDDPNFAVQIDGLTHSLPAGAATWYRFDYGISDYTARPVVSIRLPNGVVTGVGFQVWAGENTKNWWEQKPVGQGTQEILVGCNVPPSDTATPTDNEPTPIPEPTQTPTGKCPTNDLTWVGAFGAAGTYYVRVINNSGSLQNYVLIMQFQ